MQTEGIGIIAAAGSDHGDHNDGNDDHYGDNGDHDTAAIPSMNQFLQTMLGGHDDGVDEIDRLLPSEIDFFERKFAALDNAADQKGGDRMPSFAHRDDADTEDCGIGSINQFLQTKLAGRGEDEDEDYKGMPSIHRFIERKLERKLGPFDEDEKGGDKVPSINQYLQTRLGSRTDDDDGGGGGSSGVVMLSIDQLLHEELGSYDDDAGSDEQYD